MITLAIADTDSTIVYYRIANGLLSPELETEAAKEEKKNKRKKKKRKVEDEMQEDKSGTRCEEDRIDPFQEEELWSGFFSRGKVWSGSFQEEEF